MGLKGVLRELELHKLTVIVPLVNEAFEKQATVWLINSTAEVFLTSSIMFLLQRKSTESVWAAFYKICMSQKSLSVLCIEECGEGVKQMSELLVFILPSKGRGC